MMLDVDGDSLVTRAEMVEVIKECRAAGAHMRAEFDGGGVALPGVGSVTWRILNRVSSTEPCFECKITSWKVSTLSDGANLPEPLRRLAANVQRDPSGAKRAFDACDSHRDGQLAGGLYKLNPPGVPQRSQGARFQPFGPVT